MRFLGLDISRKKKPTGSLAQNVKQPDNLFLAMAKWKDETEYHVRFSHKKIQGDMPVHVQNIPMVDLLEVAQDVEAFIVSKWGGGIWQVQITDEDNRLKATYNLIIAGSVYNSRKKTKSGEPDDEEKKKQKKTTEAEAWQSLAMKMMEATMGGAKGDPIEMVTKLAGAMQAMGGGNSALEDIAQHMITANFDNNVTKDENRFADLRHIIEIGQMFAPKVPAEDPLSNVINALPGVLTGLAAMKGAQGAPPGALPVGAMPTAAGNGGVDVGALKSLAASIPPEVIAGLPAEQRLALNQLRQVGTPGLEAAAVLERPGMPAQAAPVAEDAHTRAVEGMIAEINHDLSSGIPDREIAGKMIGMVTYARNFTKQPHPMLAGVLRATEETGQEEFIKLCQQLPSLANNGERIQQIGATILELMAEAEVESQVRPEPETPAPINAQAPPVNAQTPPASGELDDIDFAFETRAEKQSGVTDNEEHAPGPAGIPGGAAGPTKTGADTAEGVEDTEDREQLRESA